MLTTHYLFTLLPLQALAALCIWLLLSYPERKRRVHAELTAKLFFICTELEKSGYRIEKVDVGRKYVSLFVRNPDGSASKGLLRRGPGGSIVSGGSVSELIS